MVSPANVALVDEMATVSVPTIAEHIADEAVASGVDAELAIKISYCESRWRQYDKQGKPLRGMHNPDDVGLFQINENYHLSRANKLGYDIYSTEGNIDYAMWLLANEGSKPWRWSKPCWSKPTVLPQS